MLFVVRFEDVYADHPERLPERAAHMDRHLAFLAAHTDRIVAAGALRPSPDAVPTGGLWIVDAETRADVEALYRQDPFWEAGLRRSVHVSYWAKAHWSAAFTACMATLP